MNNMCTSPLALLSIDMVVINSECVSVIILDVALLGLLGVGFNKYGNLNALKASPLQHLYDVSSAYVWRNITSDCLLIGFSSEMFGN